MLSSVHQMSVSVEHFFFHPLMSWTYPYSCEVHVAYCWRCYINLYSQIHLRLLHRCVTVSMRWRHREAREGWALLRSFNQVYLFIPSERCTLLIFEQPFLPFLFFFSCIWKSVFPFSLFLTWNWNVFFYMAFFTAAISSSYHYIGWALETREYVTRQCPNLNRLDGYRRRLSKN